MVGRKIAALAVAPAGKTPSTPNTAPVTPKKPAAAASSKHTPLQFVRNLQKKLRRESQIALLFTSLFLVVVLILAFLELNSR